MKERLHKKKRQAQLGMSLMEILVAVLLLSLITLATVDTVFRANNIREDLNKINDVYHSARVVLDRMTRELASAYIAKAVPGPDKSKVPQTIFKAKEESPINRLVFSSFSHVRRIRNSAESDQHIVTYYGKSNTSKRGSVYRLFRRVKTFIDGKPEEGGVAYELLDNVVKLEFKYWDKLKKDWRRDWDTTKIEFRSLLPALVEIKLTVQDERGKNIEFLTRTRIFMNRIIAR